MSDETSHRFAGVGGQCAICGENESQCPGSYGNRLRRPAPPPSDELAAFVGDEAKVRDFLFWARHIPRDQAVWSDQRHMADRFLAIHDALVRLHAEPPQRALEWEMAREIEALQVRLADREAKLAAAKLAYGKLFVREAALTGELEAAEAKLRAVGELLSVTSTPLHQGTKVYFSLHRAEWEKLDAILTPTERR